MKLPNSAIQEFKETYKEEVGDDISDEEATEKAINMLNLMNTLTNQAERGNNED